MKISLKSQSLKRYRDMLILFYKYGRGDLVKNAPLEGEPIPSPSEKEIPPEAHQLTQEIEKMGPTFIKLGQLLSTRADFLPPGYTDALARLQDKVEPFSYDEVQSIVSMEVGARLSKAFLEFDPTPVAAASLGQVHRAVLRSGQVVAVKVQRPNAREIVLDDLEALGTLASFLDDHTEIGKRVRFSEIIEELRKTLLRELDYRQEAIHLKLIGNHLRSFKNIVIPAPIDDYSSSRVLTMEFIDGQKITSFSPLIKLDLDGVQLADELFHAYLHQILVLGMFHADPHPGNVFLTNDHRIALLDLGMVGRMGPRLQDQLLKFLLAMSHGQSDRAADIVEKIGEAGENYDSIAFKRYVAELVSTYHAAQLHQIQTGRVLLEVQRFAVECHLHIPPEFTLLGKTLLNIDQAGRALDPGFNPNESLRRHTGEIMRERLLQSLKPTNLFGNLMEAKEILEELPTRMNNLLDLISTNRLKVKVETFDENLMVTTLQKIANRIALGLILASLILGASFLMRIETAFRIWGYPGLALILFLLAVVGAFALAIEIVIKDEPQKK